MRPRVTKADCLALAERADRERSILQLALSCIVLEDPDTTERATSDGWTYRLYAHRLTSPHGGIVIVRSHCLTNDQTDSVIACYLDELADRFAIDRSPEVHEAIGRLKIIRQRLSDDELADRPYRSV